MRPNTKLQIYLKHYEIFISVSVCVFNVWPKATLLLPVWSRDAKWLDIPDLDKAEWNRVQPGAPNEGFEMGSRTWGVEEL